jgi:hypothetical protein
MQEIFLAISIMVLLFLSYHIFMIFETQFDNNLIITIIIAGVFYIGYRIVKSHEKV